MKYFQILFLLILLINLGCSSLNSIKPTKGIEQYMGDDIEVLLNKENKEDEKINLAMRDCAIALEQLNKSNPKITTFLKSIVDTSKLEEVRLVDFLQEFKLRKSFEAFLPKGKTILELEERLRYKDVKYFFQLKKVGLKSSVDTYFGVGESINENDEIIAYQNGKKYVVSEDNAKKINLYIVSIATDDVIKVQETKNQWNRENSTRSTNNYSAVWDDYKIKNGFGYERRGKSDLRFYFTPYESNSCPGYPNSNSRIRNEFQKKENRRIAQIKQSDVRKSQVFLDDKQLVKFPRGFNSLDYHFYISVYEHDWYSAGKEVQGCVTINTCNMFNFHYLPMKYLNEWYYIDYCGFGFANSNVGDNFTVDNQKCTLTIKRTE